MSLRIVTSPHFAIGISDSHLEEYGAEPASGLRVVKIATPQGPTRRDPYGHYVCPSPGVDIDSLGLTRAGRALAGGSKTMAPCSHSLRWRDTLRRTSTGGVTLYVEQVADKNITKYVGDWSRLRGMLRIVDNTASNVSGGGERRQPLLPAGS